MNCDIATVRVLVAWALFGLAGCATTRHEAPPTVIPQPVIAEATTPPATAAPAATRRSRRNRPTARTIPEIRSQNAAAPPPLDFQQRLDHAHDQIYTWGQTAVEATDHRFAAKDKELKPVPAAPFRLGATMESLDRSDGMELGFDANLDIALRLPNIEDRLRIFITSSGLDEAVDKAGGSTGLRAGLRYQARDSIHFDVGIRLDVPPVAFASVKWMREIELGDWDFYPFVKLFAETKESVGYAAATTFDHWSGRHLLRSSTYAKWRADRDKTEWSQSFIYALANELIVPDRYGSYLKANDIARGWGLRLLASGEDTHEVTYYEASVFYTRPTVNRWLFWTIEPLVRWDRKYSWNADAGIRVGINMLFWDLARPAKQD
jgi:hypothetical protein